MGINMSNLILKEKMRQIITQGMSIAPQTVYQSLNVYQENFGADDFFNNAAIAFSQQGPLVSLICLNCSNNDIDEFLSRQLYANLELSAPHMKIPLWILQIIFHQPRVNIFVSMSQIITMNLLKFLIWFIL